MFRGYSEKHIITEVASTRPQWSVALVLFLVASPFSGSFVGAPPKIQTRISGVLGPRFITDCCTLQKLVLRMLSGSQVAAYQCISKTILDKTLLFTNIKLKFENLVLL